MTALPWYRHRWPWIIMAGPAAVLVAGAWTTWIAFASSDGLVAEDYYKQGLAINKVIAREEAAKQLGISAVVMRDDKVLRIELRGEKLPALFAHLAHGTRAGHDLRLRLARTAAGLYEAELPPLPAGRWRIAIEDPQGRWRIAKELR
jgi:hypothetical protein